MESKEKKGMILGLLGVITFSFTLPITHIAVKYFNPIVVGFGRSVIAAIVVLIVMIVSKEKLPTKKQFKSIFLVALGAVFAFPMLTSVAMKGLPVSHGAIELALLPLATTAFAIIRGKEKPSKTFIIWSLVGSSAVLIYAFSLGLGGFHFEDLILLLAVILLGLSYAEGGILSKELGSWQVIGWATLVGAPLLIIPVIVNLPSDFSAIPISGWLSLLYLGIMSQFLGYVLWYKGMALGGITKVSQIQYLQPFLVILFSAIFLGETISIFTIITAIVVVVSVIGGKNSAVK